MVENNREPEFERKPAANGHDILGTATNTATLTVNGNAAYRHGSFFEAELPVENEGAPAWQFVTTQGALSGTNVASNVTGNVFLPENPENYVYDKDGNLTVDGRFANSWDAENRLTNVTSLSGAATGSLVKLDMTYDYVGRRVQKIVSTNNGSWTPEYTNKFIYDGWNVVAVLDGGNNLIRSFVWGSDLSGSMQGAGGVGGLVSMTVDGGGTAGTYFYCYDGNGNVVATVAASSGSIAGQYEYGPFGELIRSTGPACGINPFRFSTKYQDDESGLLYYGYRHHNPSTGRWLSRDPVGERGGDNLYEFTRNDAVDRIDRLGENPYDLYLKLTGKQVPKAEGISAGGWFAGRIPGLYGYLGGVNTSVMFFPDSCEVGIYSVTAWASGRKPWQGGIGFGLGGEADVAAYVGNTTPGIADASSYSGPFYTAQGAGLEIGGAAFFGDKDKYGGRWIGLGVSAGKGTIAAAIVEWDFDLLTTIPVKPKCLCDAAIWQMP